MGVDIGGPARERILSRKVPKNTILDSALSSKLLRCWGFIYYFSTCGLMSLRLLIDHLIITVENNQSWCNDLIFGQTCWNDPALSRMAITSFLQCRTHPCAVAWIAKFLHLDTLTLLGIATSTWNWSTDLPASTESIWLDFWICSHMSPSFPSLKA